MGYANILAVLTGAPDDAEVLTMAAGLAKTHEAVARALVAFPKIDPAGWSDIYGAGFLTAEVWDALAAGERQMEDRAKVQVREAADAAGVAHGAGPGGGRVMQISAHTLWSGLTRELPLTDLVIAGQTSVKGESAYIGVFDAALMDCHAPLLVARSGEGPNGGVAAIAWDASLQAGRAVRAAIPLLKAAASVLIIQEPDRLDPGERDHADPERLADYLRLHGIADIAVKRVMSQAPGLGVAQTAAEAGAALLVCGAYGHSRLRQTLIGGATRTLLSDEAGPHLLIAH